MKNKKILYLICIIIAVVAISITVVILAPSISKHIKVNKIYNNYETISNELFSVTNNYLLSDGTIKYEQLDEVLEKISSKAYDMKAKGIIEEVYFNPEKDSSIVIEFCNGIRFIYSPEVQDLLSGSGEADIITIEPYSDDPDFRINSFLFAFGKSPEKTAKLINNEFANIKYNTAYKEKNTLTALTNFKKNSIVLWQGHGDFNETIGSVLVLNVQDKTGSFKKTIYEYYDEIIDNSIYVGKDYQLALTSKFFYSLEEDALNNCFVYLGACYSLADAYGIENDDNDIVDSDGNKLKTISLCDSILSRGAVAVAGNTRSVSMPYNASMMYDLFLGLTQKNDNKYFTLNEAIDYAKDKNGEKDPWFMVSENSEVHVLCKNSELGDCTLEEIMFNKISGDENNEKTEQNKLKTVLEDHIEADSIKYFDSTVGYDFAVIEKNGKFGLIDYNGQIILPIEYDSIDLYETAPNGLETKLLAYDTNSNAFWIEKDGTLSAGFLGGWGFENGAEIYWMDGPLMFDNFKGKVDYSYDAYITYRHGSHTLGTITNKTADVIPIQKINGYSSSSGDMLAYSVTKASEKYALFNLKTEKLLTDFIFDDYGYNGFIEGVLPVQKDGKWGYINDEGKMLTDFIYDTSYETQWGNKHMYSALNNYSIVRQGDLWGLIDNQGNEVLEVKYECISQVNQDGYVWLKSNNKWSLCQIAQ